ncbi:uroporphyrinogen-III synthase [Saccharopolyspora rhizosphaerae]|uniref:uroporphyrinogen-III synthase n=1 Tax=Saccharopolyspora rhizosphaerae TaxID=2492662 RepID=UPI001F3F9206|nr:uroporphyrinogen-III synthase [Saccharopolyspora rhizosphaerae]
MQEVLSGSTVGVTAERKAEEIGDMLARRGARVLFGAAMHTVPLPEDGELAAATREVLSAPVDFVVAITGVGFRGWVEAAGDELVQHLAGARVVARGAKAKGAVRGAGLREEWTSPSEESAEVRDHLLERGVAGKRVVLQVHGDPMLEFRRALTDAGAEVVPVAVYRWTDPVDLAPLDQLIDAVIAGEVDALPFTSAPAATNFLARADRTDRGEALRTALREVLIACVGPVTAAPIAKAGLPHVLPDRARTAALVKLVEQELSAR